MRLTQVLGQQHLGWMFKNHWRVQGKRRLIDTGAQAALECKGIKVVDALDLIKEPLPKIDLNVVGYKPKPVVWDESHPHWHSRKCHVFGNNNVVLQGIAQAQVLTNTLVVNGFPQELSQCLEGVNIPRRSDEQLQNAIMASYVFDAEQKKTAIVKVPERPAFVLPRSYGITETRKNRLVISKLIFECEKLAGRSTSIGRKIVNNAFFAAPFEKKNQLLQFEIVAETFMTSKRAIKIAKPQLSNETSQLPDLFPINETISIPSTNHYLNRNIYPMSNGTAFSNPHTVFLHYSPLEVKTVTEQPVNEDQYRSRAFLKAFTVAASKARASFGNDVKDLPQPITVQAIQTDGQSFYFGVFQLNTLDLESQSLKNYWYSSQSMELFGECLYRSGRPVLGGYNPEVLRIMSAFYNHN